MPEPDSWDNIPPHLRPPEQVPNAEALLPTPDPSPDAWESVESPQDLWRLLKRRWESGVVPHLEELRRRFMWSALSWLFSVGATYFFAKASLKHLQDLAPPTTQFIQVAPTDALMAIFQLMLLMGTLLSSPILLWHGIRFLLPALTKQERALLIPSLFLALGGGLCGFAFANFIVLPTSLTMLLQFAEDIATPQMSLLPYVGFCSMMLGVMALTFQVPLLAFVLGRLKLLKRSTLKHYWKESLVCMVIVAAVLTPSQDPFTLILVAMALFALYAVSIYVI
jgi:sec-independent protein translocase protein TatC